MPFYIPFIFIRFLTTKTNHNPLHDGKRNLSGEKLVATSSAIKIKDIKAVAKKLKLTINDLFIACLSSSIKRYFIDKGDKTT